MIGADGDVVWLQDIVRGRKDGGPTLRRDDRDITERKEAEESSENSEAFSLLVQNASDVVRSSIKTAPSATRAGRQRVLELQPRRGSVGMLRLPRGRWEEVRAPSPGLWTPRPGCSVPWNSGSAIRTAPGVA